MQKTKLPNQITVLILTLITALMWIGFSIYRAFTTTPTPSVSKEVSSSLAPSLDTGTIGKIEAALFFSESQIPGLTTATGTPTPAPSATATASPSATPTASPSATPVVSPTPRL